MIIPDKKTVDQIRRQYPVGCRIVLDQMDDPYSKIPEGTQGTVIGVDDTGSIMPAWDTGSSLSVVYGEDSCHKIATDEEAAVTLNWYGEHQQEEDAHCPRCGEVMPGPISRQALSRWAKIMVCSRCGMEEALEQAALLPKKPLMKWCAIEVPQNGGGAWKR